MLRRLLCRWLETSEYIICRRDKRIATEIVTVQPDGPGQNRAEASGGEWDKGFASAPDQVVPALR
jgi:hypothetical protein